MIDSGRIAAAAAAAIRDATESVPGVVAGITTDRATIHLDAAGVRSVDTEVPMTTDTTFAIFSTTKAITATAALQLVESRDLDLDAPAAEYAPTIGELQVIDGFDDAGDPVLRSPASAITTRQLLVHTAGFGYDFANETYRRLAAEHGQPSTAGATMASLTTPLLFDPGTRWEYGASMDWCGLVVEGITGRRLGEVMTDRIFAPLGMSDTTFHPSDGQRARMATMHRRSADGSLRTQPSFSPPADPELDMGGHGLVSTVGDYLAFIRMWLADGRADSGEQVLAPETVAMAAQNHLGNLAVRQLPGVIPAISNDFELFPGQSKSWSLGFMVNNEDAPTGRPAGSLGWTGLANLYYWIDRRNRIGGYWATQLLPFADAACLRRYLEMETAVYRALGIATIA